MSTTPGPTPSITLYREDLQPGAARDLGTVTPSTQEEIARLEAAA